MSCISGAENYLPKCVDSSKNDLSKCIDLPKNPSPEIEYNQSEYVYTALLENGHNYDDRFLVWGHYYAFCIKTVNVTILKSDSKSDRINTENRELL